MDLPSFLLPPPMPTAASPLELRVVAGGREGVGQLWQSLWWEGVHRGAVSASVVFLTVWLAMLTLSLLVRGRS